MIVPYGQLACYDSQTSGGTVTVDLSSLNSAIDNYLIVGDITGYSSKTRYHGTIVKIPANAATKAKYNGETGKMQLASGKNLTKNDLKDVDAATAADYQYRTAYTEWTDMAQGSSGSGKVADWSVYQGFGAKLFIRKKVETNGTANASGQFQELTENNKSATESYYLYSKFIKKYENREKGEVYVASSLPGREAKVTIPAKAKAPNVVCNVVKNTIKFPKNSEFRLCFYPLNSAKKIYCKEPATASAPAKMYEAPTEAMPVAKLIELMKGDVKNPVDNFYLEVRIKAQNGKAASAWFSEQVFPVVDLSEVIGDDKKRKQFSGSGREGAVDENSLSDMATLKQPGDKEYKGYGTAGIQAVEWKDLPGCYLDGRKPFKIEYIGKGGKNQYFEANAIKFTDNGCCLAFEVIVNSSATAPNENQKGIKFGGWWEPVPYLYRREVMIKNVKDGQHVWIRCIGSKKYS